MLDYYISCRGGLCAQQLNVLWHSECMLAGCMYRGMSTRPVQNYAHHSEPGFIELCVYGVLVTAKSVWVIAVRLLWRRLSLCRVICVMYISGGWPLHHFRCVDVFVWWWDPDGNVFNCWSNIGLKTIWFDWSWAFAGVTSKKDEGAIGFLCDSIYLVVPRPFAIDIYT